jgi:hypothetical protein
MADLRRTLALTSQQCERGDAGAKVRHWCVVGGGVHHPKALQMTSIDHPYMLDTNVFNDLFDEKISPASLGSRRWLVTGIH